MDQELLEQLRRENEILTRRVDHDELTGVLSRGALVREIETRLAGEGGALLYADLDDFREVNDRFGHIVGDQLLRKAAELLGYLAGRRDLLGRVGGDDFVLFLSGYTSPEAAEERCRMIERRFRQYRRGEGRANPMSITVCCALSQPGDTYATLFDRADQRLLQRKKLRREGKQTGAGRSGLVRDVRQIRDELVEESLTAGAYCQDYETFKSIYRFLERVMQRSDQQACVILLTLVDEEGEFPPPQAREHQMELLGLLLQRSLRAGDVFTRYTSCQYLLLTTNVTEELAETIAARVCGQFEEQSKAKGLLLHCCYPLRPAGGQKKGPPAKKE